MNSNTNWCIVFITIIAFILGLEIGVEVATVVERDQAVKTNVGQYVIDPKTGTALFRYGCHNE